MKCFSALLLVSSILALTAGCSVEAASDEASADDLTGYSAEARVFAAKVCPTQGYDGNADTDEPNTHRGCDLRDANIPKYQKAAAQMYELAPPFMQKILVSLEHLFIERDPDFRFDAWSFRSSGKNYIGFRSAIILKKIDFKLNFGSYDQQFFVGGRKDEIQSDLPHMDPRQSTGIDSVAGTLVALAGHEIGHLIQYRKPELAPRWTKIAWKKDGADLVPANPKIAKMRAAFCLRSTCTQDKKVARAEAEQSYRTLESSEFPSLFSMLNAEEDLCEAMAFHVIAKIARTVPFVLPQSGESLDLLGKLRAPKTSVQRQRAEFVKALEQDVLQSWD
jgi:hypothetical protein